MSNPLDAPEAPTPQSCTPVPETTDTTSSPSPSAQQHRQPLAIEDAPAGNEESTKEEETEEEVQTLDLGEGNVIKLDKLGPMIINSDRTLSRIQNWQELHPIEQERTVRLLVKKRNLVRLQKLDQENREEEGEEKLTALQQGDKA